MTERPTSIWDLRMTSWGQMPRFHPPGAHPANYRMREHYRLLSEHRQKAVQALHRLNRGSNEWLRLRDSIDQTDEMLTWLRKQIAAFEAGETDAKMHTDERYWPEFVRNQIDALPNKR